MIDFDDKRSPMWKWHETFPLTEHQERFVLNLIHPCVGMGGGWAIGKTIALCKKALLVSAFYPGIPILLGETSDKRLEEHLIPGFAEALCGFNALKESISEHPSVESFSNSTKIIHFHNRSSITFSHVTKDIDKLKLVRFGWIGIDQAEGMTDQDFKILQSINRFKLSRKLLNQIAITYCPDNELHWIYRRFLKKDKEIVGSLGHYYETDEYSTAEAGLAPKDKLYTWGNTTSHHFKKKYFDGKWVDSCTVESPIGRR